MEAGQKRQLSWKSGNEQGGAVAVIFFTIDHLRPVIGLEATLALWDFSKNNL